MDTGAFDSGASNVSAGYQKMLNGAKQANAEAARAVRDYQKQIDKYTQSKGANLPAIKQMEGKLARLQLDQKQAQATVAQTQLEERLFQATHTHEEVLIRDMRERLAVQRQLYAGNEKIQSLLTKTYNAEAAQIMAGGEGGGGKLFGHGLSGRKIVHAGKYAAGATLGSEGGELGAAIGMGLMVGGVAGVALGGAMLIASAYHQAKERADRLVDSQIKYNKELRESKAWWDKLVDRQNTTSGSQHAARALELEEKAQDIRDEQEAQVKKRGWLESFGEWGARKYIGLTGQEDTHETTGDADARAAKTRALELENEAVEHRQEADRGVKLSIAREAQNNRDKITAASIATRPQGYDRSRDELLLQNEMAARASKQRYEDRMHDLDKGNAPHERKVEEQQRRDAEVDAEKQIAALKLEGFENDQKRQDRAGYLENRAVSAGMYKRGYDAQIAVLHEQRDNELDMFEGTEDGKQNIKDKYRHQEYALTRQHKDEIAAIDSSTRSTVIETNERGLTMELDLLKEAYQEKVRLAKGNADDIAAITRKYQADQAKAKEADALQETEYLRHASFAAKEIAATTAAEKEKVREQQIHDDAIAAGKTEDQANARVAAQHKIFEAEQDQAGRAAHLALHPYESYLKHKAELDAKVGHGGYTKADEAKELTREWRAMQGPAGQFFNSGESRWKAIQTELLNPQDTAEETLKVTNQMAKDIRALLTGGLKLTG
jgi:hypothetical protein